MKDLIDRLKGVPVLGALLKGEGGGVTSTEFGLLAALVAAALAAGRDIAWPYALVLGLSAVGVGLYAMARSKAKAEA